VLEVADAVLVENDFAHGKIFDEGGRNRWFGWWIGGRLGDDRNNKREKRDEDEQLFQRNLLGKQALENQSWNTNGDATRLDPVKPEKVPTLAVWGDCFAWAALEMRAAMRGSAFVMKKRR
jgi:hypothetical protein